MVKHEAATGLKSQPAKSNNASSPTRSHFDEVMYQRNLFMTMALDMTWQLALVVVIPIVGGYMLDQHYHKSPWLTLAGVVVAGIGVFGVMSRIVAEANQRTGYDSAGKSKERS